MKRFESLLLLDPELGNPGGHYFTYAETIRQACDGLGIAFSALGGEGSVVPAFDRINTAYVPRWMGGALVNPFLGGRRMRVQLRRNATIRADGRTLAFAATANHRHYAALAGWLEELPDDTAPKLAVLLRFPEYDSKRKNWNSTAHLTRRGLSRLESAARRRTIRLIADSEGLAAEYRQLSGLPVAALPIPHMVPEGESAMARRRGGDAPFRLGYFGEARREKGFHLLVEALEILADSRRTANLEFVVQSYVREGFEAQGEGTACQRLAAQELANVRVLEGTLEPARFLEEFLACDAVVLPYLLERYRARNSGVFVDAVAAGISVVVTHGTWMDEQLTRGYGAGLTTMDGDAAALADAMAEIGRRRDEMHDKARLSAAAWRDMHDPNRFLVNLIGLFACPLKNM